MLNNAIAASRISFSSFCNGAPINFAWCASLHSLIAFATSSASVLALLKPSDDPHHLIGWGQGGMATKAHDIFAIPLCRQCHTELHNDPVKFERKHVPQPVMIIRVLDRAYGLGVLA